MKDSIETYNNVILYIKLHLVKGLENSRKGHNMFKPYVTSHLVVSKK